MAQASLLDEQQRRGEVPSVCAVTGRPTTSVVSIKVASTKGWTWILLPFGVLPFLIARVFSADVWIVHLPVHSSAWARYLRWRRLCWLVIAVGIAVAVTSIVPQSVVLGIVVVVVGIATSVAHAWVFPSVHRAGRNFPGFVVSRCHPDFAYQAGVLARRSEAMQTYLSRYHT